MDDKWFKLQQKKAGVTADDIAQRIGKDRSAVSKIYSGQRAMSLEWAQAFAEAFGVTVAEVLERAGAAPRQVTQQLAPGFSESDAVPFVHRGAEDRRDGGIAAALGARPGVDIWTIRTAALSLMGYMPGDQMLVDTLQAERVRAGDVVVAQVYDNSGRGAVTVLRRFEPPVLVAASMDPDERRVHVVDGTNVVIRGKVVASWRV